MRSKITFIIISLCVIFRMVNASAQSLRYNIALPYTGLSAYSTQQNDPLSFTSNQAALVATRQAGIGLYGERRFLLAATSGYNIAAALPSKMGNFGLQLNYFGFKNFNENRLGLAYARNLGKIVDAGIQFNYYGYHIPAYSHASTLNYEGGIIIHFTNKLNGGIHVYNPVAGKLGKNDEDRLASVYKLGLGYDASESFFVSGEIIKEEDKPVNVIAGFQYQFAQQFFIRAGFRSESSTIFAGAGVAWKNLRVDAAGSYHPQLGFSPGILLIAWFKNKQAE